MTQRLRSQRRPAPIPVACEDPGACCPPVGARANGRGRSGAPGSRVEPAGTAELSRRLKALADPTRLAIVSCLLSAPESVCVCDLTCEFDLGQPTISHHLKRLRQAGLVRAQRRGTWVHYRADRAAIEGVRQALARL